MFTLKSEKDLMLKQSVYLDWKCKRNGLLIVRINATITDKIGHIFV